MVLNYPIGVRTCVVIPTYNEVDNIDDVISQVLMHDGIDIAIVDDSSPDGTAEKVKDWEDKTNGQVTLYSRNTKDGLGPAYIYGFNKCISKGYEIICEMDADLSHDPAALVQLIKPIEHGNTDLVLGSRYIKGGSIPNWSVIRKLLSRSGNVYARIMLGLKMHDATGGFRAYRVSLLEKILRNEIRSDGYGFQIEMAYLATLYGAEIKEVPIAFNDRIRGESKMSFKIVQEALVLVTSTAIRDRVLRRKRHIIHERDNMADKSIEENRDQDQFEESK